MLPCDSLHGHFCACKGLPYVGSSLLEIRGETVLKAFLLANFLMIAYQILLLIVRKCLRMIASHRRARWELNKARNIFTQTSILDRYVEETDPAVGDAKLAEMMQKAVEKLAVELRDKDRQTIDNATKMSKFFGKETISCIAKNFKSIATNWICKASEMKEAPKMLQLCSNQTAQNEKVVQILLRQQDMKCETDSAVSEVFRPDSKTSAQSGLLKRKSHKGSKHVDIGCVNSKESVVYHRNAKELKRHSRVRRKRTQISVNSRIECFANIRDRKKISVQKNQLSKYGNSTKVIYQNERILKSRRNSRKHQKAERASTSQRASTSDSTIRNSSRSDLRRQKKDSEYHSKKRSKSSFSSTSGTKRFRSDSRFRNSTPEVHIEFNVKKRRGGKPKKSNCKACFKCGKCLSCQRLKHRRVIDAKTGRPGGTKSVRKLGRSQK